MIPPVERRASAASTRYTDWLGLLSWQHWAYVGKQLLEDLSAFALVTKGQNLSALPKAANWSKHLFLYGLRQTHLAVKVG